MGKGPERRHAAGDRSLLRFYLGRTPVFGDVGVSLLDTLADTFVFHFAQRGEAVFCQGDESTDFPVEGATGYTIYSVERGALDPVAVNVQGTRFLDTKIKPGEEQTYSIYAIDQRGVMSACSKFYIFTRPLLW